MAQTYFVTGVKLTFPVPRTPGLVRPEWNDYLHFRCYPLSVKEKTDLERAGLDRYKKRGRERDLWTRSENEIDRDPESRPSNLFFLLLQEDFSPSFVSSQGLIYLSIDRSISRCRTRIYTYLYIHIGRIVWDGNSIRMEGKPGAELPGSRGAL